METGESKKIIAERVWVSCLRSHHRVGAGILLLDAQIRKYSEISHGRKEQEKAKGGREDGNEIANTPQKKECSPELVQSLCVCMHACIPRKDCMSRGSGW